MSFHHVDAVTLKSWLHDGQELALFDVREHGQYGAEHLLFATPLPYSVLERDIARLAPRRQVRIVLADNDETVASKAADRLAACGYSNVHVLRNGIQGWRDAGYGLFAGVNVPSKTFGELVEHACNTPSVSATQLAQWITDDKNMIVLDGRPYSEYQKMNIPGAICCPNGELAYRIHDLVQDEATTIVVNCAGRTRSILGAQTLINLGIKSPVFALENGTQGWVLNDLQLENGSTQKYPDPVTTQGLEQARQHVQVLADQLNVPVVNASEVAELLKRGTTSVFLCDVRTDEEFAAGTLPGAQHTPGGQLVQATDQYIGVRNARIVVFDSDGVRAPVIASWLRQMGHDASVLQDGLQADHNALMVAGHLAPPSHTLLREISATDLAALMKTGSPCIVDVRSSAAYRKGHIPKSIWSIRPLIAQHVPQGAGTVVVVADDPVLAALAASELGDDTRVHYLRDGIRGWCDAGFEVEATPDTPPDSERIDYLFFVHDRHDGNKNAARQYLAWELGLIAQLDAQDRSVFTPVVLEHTG